MATFSPVALFLPCFTVAKLPLKWPKICKIKHTIIKHFERLSFSRTNAGKKEPSSREVSTAIRA
jgi:hypothetical protein